MALTTMSARSRAELRLSVACTRLGKGQPGRYVLFSAVFCREAAKAASRDHSAISWLRGLRDRMMASAVPQLPAPRMAILGIKEFYRVGGKKRKGNSFGGAR